MKEHRSATAPLSGSKRRLGQALRWLVVAGAAAGLVAFAAFTWGDLTGGPDLEELILTPVERQDVDIVITERGTLEAASSQDLICEVESRSPGAPATTIKWIIPEGTFVKKGDLVCELDSAALEDQIRAQRIKVEQAKAALTAAEAELEIVRSQNESDIKAAERAVQLAEIDLKKYVEGDYPKERRRIEGDILIAREELRRAQERLQYTERLYRKGFVSATDVEADRLAVMRAKNTLETAEEELRVLEEYTKPRTITELEGALDEAKRALERVKTQARAKEAQAQDALLAQKATYETELATLKNLETQLAKCKLYAPCDGMVVYANERSRWRNEVMIEEGASVREGQKIIQIPMLDSMQVNVKVHEAKVTYVKPGQRAIVRVESRPDLPLRGTVKSVATMADAQSWFSTGVQVFTVLVALDDPPEGLKPGMTANVQILADRVEGVLAVPVHAVMEVNGHYFCFVKRGDNRPEPVEVQLGPSNDKLVVIESGLQEGDLVVNNVIAVADDDTLRRLREQTKGSAVAERDKKLFAEEARRHPIARAGSAPDTPSASPASGASGGAAKKRPGRRFGRGGFQIPASGADYIARTDKNGDGVITVDELPERIRSRFSQMDSNDDGKIDLTEANAIVRRLREMMKRFQQGGGPAGPGTPGRPGGSPGAGSN